MAAAFRLGRAASQHPGAGNGFKSDRGRPTHSATDKSPAHYGLAAIHPSTDPIKSFAHLNRPSSKALFT
jgi:hypothetical protein